MRLASATNLTFVACAKVNLCLAVGYPPHDGYHPVRSVFQQLDLHDIVQVGVLGATAEAPLVTACGSRILLDCDVAGLDASDNLVFRAIDAAELACGTPVVPAGAALAIDVVKVIPAGGGLGGGSSDAAAALRAYAQLTGIDALDPRLVGVARKLGADVSFFLYGGCALMGDRGDVLEEALPTLAAPIVLMGSSHGISTPAIYAAFDDCPAPAPDADALACALRADPHDIERIASLCANNLEGAVRSADPDIATRLDVARSHPDALCAHVSGSGATCFAICADMQAARRFADDIAPACAWVHVCDGQGLVA